MPRPGAPNEWDRARLDLEVVLAQRLDFRVAAAAHIARWPNHPPDFFAYSSQTRRCRVRRAFGDGAGWAARLMLSVETVAHFSLHAEHLGLPRSAAAPRLLFDPANVARWKAAITAHFRGPCRWRLAIGGGGRIHAHVLADLSDGPPNIRRGGELAKPCESYLEAAVAYQLEPPLEYTVAGLAVWLEHRARGRRSPRLSGVANIPSAAALGHRSSLREYFPTQPTVPAETAPQLPAPAPAAPPRRRAHGLPGEPRPFRPSGSRLILCRPVDTAPPAPPGAAAAPTSEPVRHTGRRSPPRSRGPPESASAAPHTLDLSPSAERSNT